MDKNPTPETLGTDCCKWPIGDGPDETCCFCGRPCVLRTITARDHVVIAPSMRRWRISAKLAGLSREYKL